MSPPPSQAEREETQSLKHCILSEVPDNGWSPETTNIFTEYNPAKKFWFKLLTRDI
jgi:hypothetical protein